MYAMTNWRSEIRFSLLRWPSTRFLDSRASEQERDMNERSQSEEER